MVLKRVRSAVLGHVFLSAVVLCFGVAARAAVTGVTEDMTVARSECPVKTRYRWREEWRPYAGQIAKGTIVKGVRPHGKPDVVLFQIPSSEDFFAASWRCMFAENSEAVDADKKTYSGWHLTLGLISWQESFNYTDVSGNKYPLRASVIGLCSGDGYLVRMNHFDVGFTGCLAYGKAFVTPKGSARAQISYEVRNRNVWALLAGPTVLYRPEADFAAFGIFVPFMPRFALWPEPNESSVGSRFSFLPGLLFEARIERASWSLSQRAGVLGSLSDWIWLFAINKDFR